MAGRTLTGLTPKGKYTMLESRIKDFWIDVCETFLKQQRFCAWRPGASTPTRVGFIMMSFNSGDLEQMAYIGLRYGLLIVSWGVVSQARAPQDLIVTVELVDRNGGNNG